jgi:hypothetical protein
MTTTDTKRTRREEDNPAVRHRDETEPPLAWTATEFVYRKRWWWYAVMTIVGLWLLALSIALSQWSAAVLVLASVVTFYVVGVGKAKEINYRLTGTAIRAGRRTYAFDGFRTFAIESSQERRGLESREYLVLSPKSRFSPLIFIYFPDEAGLAGTIVARFSLALPEARHLR